MVIAAANISHSARAVAVETNRATPAPPEPVPKSRPQRYPDRATDKSHSPRFHNWRDVVTATLDLRLAADHRRSLCRCLPHSGAKSQPRGSPARPRALEPHTVLRPLPARLHESRSAPFAI